MSMRQKTIWQWNYIGAKNTKIRIGWIYNKNKGVKKDIIRLQIISLTDIIDINMRIDEAASIIAGLGKVLCKQMINDNVILRRTNDSNIA